MSNNNIDEAKSCSKYSLWVVYSGLAKKFDTFKETMERIKEIRLETMRNRTRKTWEVVKIWKNAQFVTKALGS
jgi:hypothetical protein